MKNVLVTGSSVGIGKEICEVLINAGYKVFCTGRREYIDATNYLSIDLSRLENVKILYDYVTTNFGHTDILVSNAGQYLYSPVEKTSLTDAVRLFNLNFLAHYLLSGYVIPGMKQNGFGRIINISSISGILGEANASAYAASKSAFYGFSKSLALELAPYGITVNSISPGWVDTALSQNALLQQEKSEILDVIPQRRFVEVVEVAKLVRYLVSDDAKGITGQNINICAGLTCGC